MTVEITERFYVRSVLYRGHLPAVVIGDGTDEFVLFAGARRYDAQLGKEFAWNLVAAAVGFAGMCNRLLTAVSSCWPTDDYEAGSGTE
ncbi:hypothetical protein FB471_4449 [Amycolatopsis cihanbeyliensis]|uniref:Uncharacterized protein n=2 Tax=Amycolatopsis cihanbeyliensis TaxID=1128664 RepID=A0A542DNI2_AMYCI|nr:hypothetical protein FB471_4449 [Amycolatopsis cihanbeyliensis]